MKMLTRMPAARSAAVGVADRRAVRQHVEAALRGQLVRLLRHERHLVGPDARGDPGHLGRRGHLDVELGRHHLPEQLDVALLDVAAVAAQMDGDALRAGQLGEDGGGHRLRLARLTRLSDGGDVIDVDS